MCTWGRWLVFLFLSNSGLLFFMCLYVCLYVHLAARVSLLRLPSLCSSLPTVPVSSVLSLLLPASHVAPLRCFFLFVHHTLPAVD